MTETSTPRTARCTYYGARCTTEVPSAAAADHGTFFEDRGPGSAYAAHTCAVCRYHDVAHARWAEPGGRHPNGVQPHEFTPMVDGAPYDSYYCGCWGWD